MKKGEFWIKALAKSAKRSPQGLYYMLKKAGAKAPYSELFTWTLLRAKGFPCNGYRPVADAVGKPEPPLLKKEGKQVRASEADGHSAVAPVGSEPVIGTPERLMARLAKLIGRPDKNNRNRIRYYMKQAGIRNMKKIDEATALEVLARRGIDISKFEYARPPGEVAKPVSTEPATTYKALLVQYNEMAAQLAQSQEEVAQRDARGASLNDLVVLVRDTLKKYQGELLDVAKSRFGGMPRPLEYPLFALNDILEFERRQSKRATTS
jgi:hypothetical protein